MPGKGGGGEEREVFANCRHFDIRRTWVTWYLLCCLSRLQYSVTCAACFIFIYKKMDGDLFSASGPGFCSINPGFTPYFTMGIDCFPWKHPVHEINQSLGEVQSVCWVCQTNTRIRRQLISIMDVRKFSLSWQCGH